MEKDVVYDYFIETIKNKIPERGRLANILVDALLLEKEAIYRRLRGEVPFTFSEIVKISKELDISLDNIVGGTSSKIRPFQMRLIDFEKPTETDYLMQEHYANMLKAAAKDPNSETGTASNVIPINLCIAYEYIYRFYRLKWVYQLGDNPRKYNEIQLADRLIEMNKKTILNSQEIATSYYIWNDQILFSLINDIKYFANIKYITPEEVSLLKKDIMRFVDDFEQLAIDGQYKTGKEVFIFISNLNFETSYSYIETKEYYHTVIRSFTLNDTTSMDKEVFDKIKKWMQSLIRTSTLISGSNEVQRILFFEKQREAIEKNL